MTNYLASKFLNNHIKKEKQYCPFYNNKSTFSNFPNNNIKRNFITTCMKENSKRVAPDDGAICIDKPLEWPTGKRAHFKFHEETEAAMNKQINAEFKAFYYYLSMVRKEYDITNHTLKKKKGIKQSSFFAYPLHIYVHIYTKKAAYFGRVDVALPGCESYFMQMHQEEYEHALRFVNYVKMRGGQVILCPILPPVDLDWKCPLHAFKVNIYI